MREARERSGPLDRVTDSVAEVEHGSRTGLLTFVGGHHVEFALDARGDQRLADLLGGEARGSHQALAGLQQLTAVRQSVLGYLRGSAA